jgi:hypothetical protein
MAEDPWEAVYIAVKEQVENQKHSVLGPRIRVTIGTPDGSLGENVMIPPYEEEFPDLFSDLGLEFTVASVGS